MKKKMVQINDVDQNIQNQLNARPEYELEKDAANIKIMSSTPAVAPKKAVIYENNEYANHSRNNSVCSHMRRVYSQSAIRENKRVEPHRLSNSYSKQMYSFSKSSR